MDQNQRNNWDLKILNILIWDFKIINLQVNFLKKIDNKLLRKYLVYCIKQMQI